MKKDWLKFRHHLEELVYKSKTWEEKEEIMSIVFKIDEMIEKTSNN